MTRDELRAAIRGHLAGHPGLTAWELSRALEGWPAASQVRAVLVEMEAAGEARHEAGQRTATDRRLAIRWEAT